ncbi:MAG: TetR/AcrR family transcriptional regulator [Marivita sp.]|uniref:TetR/AcrR family transcriptional regulator n=1 Tax=Marivita sp. TaxID=2003365 RepID=UPI003EF91DE4
MPRKPEYDRDALIDRARDLFWKQGWAGTSLKDLEHALNVKPGSFYAAFGSKGALFELTLDRYAENGTARLRALVDAHGALGALKRYPALVIEPSGSNPRACMLAKTVLELGSLDDPLAARANFHLSNMEMRFAALFRAAQAKGQISKTYDADALARRYQSDLLGLRVSAERDGVDANAIATEIASGLDRLSIPATN